MAGERQQGKNNGEAKADDVEVRGVVWGEVEGEGERG